MQVPNLKTSSCDELTAKVLHTPNDSFPDYWRRFRLEKYCRIRCYVCNPSKTKADDQRSNLMQARKRKTLMYSFLNFM
jgi:hypothetical protein